MSNTQCLLTLCNLKFFLNLKLIKIDHIKRLSNSSQEIPPILRPHMIKTCLSCTGFMADRSNRCMQKIDFANFKIISFV